MIYNLTEKLRFGSDPVLKIRDTELTVRADAEIVLELLDTITNRGELEGARAAFRTLLSPEDQKKLSALHLKMDDYIAAMKAAVQLAMGADPDEEAPGE